MGPAARGARQWYSRAPLDRRLATSGPHAGRGGQAGPARGVSECEGGSRQVRPWGPSVKQNLVREPSGAGRVKKKTATSPAATRRRVCIGAFLGGAGGASSAMVRGALRLGAEQDGRRAGAPSHQGRGRGRRRPPGRVPRQRGRLQPGRTGDDVRGRSPGRKRQGGCGGREKEREGGG